MSERVSNENTRCLTEGLETAGAERVDAETLREIVREVLREELAQLSRLLVGESRIWSLISSHYPTASRREAIQRYEAGER